MSKPVGFPAGFFLLTNRNKFVNLEKNMVNENKSTKQKILEVLRASTEPVSGEKLAGESGVSRTAVWKSIQSLQKSGYGIIVGRSGYVLERDLSNSLCPWEFGKEEKAFIHFDATDSTMTEARKIAMDQSGSEIRCVTTDMQTNGRGHQNHKWHTTQESLAFTLICRDKILGAEENRLVMAAMVSACSVLNRISDKNFYLRWPNDIWTREGKVSGILDEYNCVGGECSWVNLGIGINYMKKPALKKTDSVFGANAKVSRKEFVSLFMNEFDETRKSLLSLDSSLCNKWNSLCMDLGKSVVCKESENYVFEGINAYGWAVLKENSGDAKRIVPPGKISFVK